MANQTLILNVSDEMKLDNDRGILCEESGVEELYSSSVPDACGDGSSDDALWFWAEIEVHNHKMLWF